MNRNDRCWAVSFFELRLRTDLRPHEALRLRMFVGLGLVRLCRRLGFLRHSPGL